MPAAFGVLVVLGSSFATGAVSNTAFPRSTALVTWSGATTGCSLSEAAKPHFDVGSGIGRVILVSRAKTCPALKGGTSVVSTAQAQVQVGLAQTETLGRAATSIAIAWNLSATGGTNTSGRPKDCATQTTASSYALYIAGSFSTWVYLNQTLTDCLVESFWEVSGTPYVYDVTTGQYTYAANYLLQSNVSGSEYTAYRDVYNYSNASYRNVTHAGSTLVSWGSAATLHFAWDPTWYVNGTFAAGDHLVVYATLSLTTLALVNAARGAHADTSFSATGATGHVDLASITIR